MTEHDKAPTTNLIAELEKKMPLNKPLAVFNNKAFLAEFEKAKKDPKNFSRFFATIGSMLKDFFNENNIIYNFESLLPKTDIISNQDMIYLLTILESLDASRLILLGKKSPRLKMIRDQMLMSFKKLPFTPGSELSFDVFYSTTLFWKIH